MQTVESNVEAGQVESETAVVTGVTMPKPKRKFVPLKTFLLSIQAAVTAGKSVEDVAEELDLEVATVEQRISKERSKVAKDKNLSEAQKLAFKKAHSFKRGSSGPRKSGADVFALSGVTVEAEKPADETAQGEQTEQTPETPAESA